MKVLAFWELSVTQHMNDSESEKELSGAKVRENNVTQSATVGISGWIVFKTNEEKKEMQAKLLENREEALHQDDNGTEPMLEKENLMKRTENTGKNIIGI
ncbi:hypothetical protein NPIL_171271 [Nephila pilipes]|uniref:Uncharacterized protein n=1 Tax=Nephila pilipes TaxID=299642 RepID=A0A8X6UBT0_NEPPI|nr:hypothetical protein NPIL_171271 [Nephila pilipes]